MIGLILSFGLICGPVLDQAYAQAEAEQFSETKKAEQEARRLLDVKIIRVVVDAIKDDKTWAKVAFIYIEPRKIAALIRLLEENDFFLIKHGWCEELGLNSINPAEVFENDQYWLTARSEFYCVSFEWEPRE